LNRGRGFETLFIDSLEKFSLEGEFLKLDIFQGGNVLDDRVQKKEVESGTKT
jgi:hypothetical protein